MKHELNLTAEQKQRIADAKTDDERVKILTEALGGIEL